MPSETAEQTTDQNGRVELAKLISRAALGSSQPVAARRTRSADQTDNLCRKLRGSEPVQQQSTAVSPLLSAVQRGSSTLTAPERRLARPLPSLCKQGVRGSSPLGSTYFRLSEGSTDFPYSESAPSATFRLPHQVGGRIGLQWADHHFCDDAAADRTEVQVGNLLRFPEHAEPAASRIGIRRASAQRGRRLRAGWRPPPWHGACPDGRLHVSWRSRLRCGSAGGRS